MMTERARARTVYDRWRQKRHQWRKWYSTGAWKRRRKEQLTRIPWCEPCKALGKSRIAEVVNHLKPHNGDRYLFFHGPLESVCKNCHDSAIQRAESRGYRADIDDDGWPTDPNHPFNKKGPK